MSSRHGFLRTDGLLYMLLNYKIFKYKRNICGNFYVKAPQMHQNFMVSATLYH